MERKDKKIIALSSVTYAMKGETLLRAHSIPAQMVRLEAGQTRRGCAYGLKIPSHTQREASALLQENRIPFSQIISGN